MRSNEWVSLLIAVIIGVLWIFLGQPYVFQHGFHTLLVGPGMNLQTFLRNGSSPGFTVFWAGCLSALLVWYFITFTSRTSQSSQVRSMRVMWWIAAIILVIFGWLCQLFFAVLWWLLRGLSPLEGGAGVNYFPIPIAGWMVLLLMIVLDVALLFWLPTVLASPRSYRLVVPGAVSMKGGR